MIPDIGERPVTADEWLARYILRREHVRADGTLKLLVVNANPSRMGRE